MANRVCTNFIDDNGLDVGCKLVSKEYVLEAYPELVPWMKTPALWAWGTYTGDNTNIITRSSPVQTIAGGINWKSTSTGFLTHAAIKTDGTLWLWGAFSGLNYGQIGDNSIVLRSSPVQTFSGGTNWKQVSVGNAHTIAIKTDNTLWTWGGSKYGQLGTNNTILRSTPVQTITGGTNWKTVSAGKYHSTAIKTDGTLWLWGYGYLARLGNNSTVSISSPVQTTSAGTNWKQVSAGTDHTAAIKTDGTLWTWGRNSHGQLGDQTLINRSTPIQTVSAGTDWKQISVGNYVSAAIKTNGTLWLWGNNYTGVLGNNNRIDRSSPVQTISGGTNWQSVSACNLAAFAGSSAAIKTDGTLWLWGVNGQGQLGIESTTNMSSPVQTISGGTGWKSIFIGGRTALAIRDEGDF